MKAKKLITWNRMSAAEKSFLASSYERYKDSIAKVSGSYESDSFASWLAKRGIHFNFQARH